MGREHAEHLEQSLRKNYRITTDWKGELYCGITLKWDYERGTVQLSMPGYIERALQRFQHPTPSKAEEAPHAWTKPNYGAKIQYTPDEDNTQLLSKQGMKRVMEIVGTLLYYARAIDNTMQVALTDISAAQTKATEHTLQATVKLLNYAATYPEAILTYSRSDMTLHVHTDASYLSAPKARSRRAAYHFMGDGNINNQQHNGPVLVSAGIMNNVMSSAAEAEVGAAFHSAKDACPIRETLQFLGHEQPATPIQTDNECANGILNDTVKQKRSKAMDMRFYWLQDRVQQGMFHIYWKPGSTNLADFHSKHHSPSYTKETRSKCITDGKKTNFNTHSS